MWEFGARGLAVALLAAGVVAGCGGPAPPAAGDVARAVQAVRDAGTGRYEAVVTRESGGGSDWNGWGVEYDLGQPAYHARLTVGSSAARGYRIEWVGTSRGDVVRDVTFTEPDEWERRRPYPPRTSPPAWTRELPNRGTTPHVRALLGFRPSPADGDVRREGDGWVVTGTVPRPDALDSLALIEVRTADEERVVATLATAPARLVLGPDLRVRELRLDGDDVARGADLPTGLRGKVAPAMVTIRLTGVGVPVTISTSSPAEQVPPATP
jgi:hypothetical protein